MRSPDVRQCDGLTFQFREFPAATTDQTHVETGFGFADDRDHAEVVFLAGLEGAIEAENCPRAFNRPAVRFEPVFFEDRAFCGYRSLLIQTHPRRRTDCVANAR